MSAFTPEEHERMVRSLMRQHRLRREDAETLIDARGGRPAKRNPLMERQWASLLHRMCRAIQTDKAEPRGIFHSVFWIRLYGAITEIHDRFDKFPGLRDSIPSAWPGYAWAIAGAEVFDACASLRASLSEDELVFAAFVRHVHAHVYQEGFEYDLEPGNREKKQRGAVRSATMVRPVRRHVKVDEVHAIVDRIHLAHGNDEEAIAKAFANKTVVHVERLDNALKHLEEIRQVLDAAYSALNNTEG